LYALCQTYLDVMDVPLDELNLGLYAVGNRNPLASKDSDHPRDEEQKPSTELAQVSDIRLPELGRLNGETENREDEPEEVILELRLQIDRCLCGALGDLGLPT
jgi:hypothetical protein